MPRRILIDTELRPIAVKITDIVHTLPKLDAHFWVVRDGKIIDPHFPYYDMIKSIHNGKKFIYHPADATTQTIMKAIVMKNINRYYPELADFVADYKKIMGEEKAQGYCLHNALMEIDENGGELVFGSWGVELKDGSKFWEFGGEDYIGVKAFFKERTFKGMIL
jgi:hypothetical protein